MTIPAELLADLAGIVADASYATEEDEQALENERPILNELMDAIRSSKPRMRQQ